jgi:hypothetical protein
MGEEHVTYTHYYNINEPINHLNYCIRCRPSLTCSYTVLSPWNGFLCFGNCHSLHHMMSKSSVRFILQYRLCSQGPLSFRSRQIHAWTAKSNPTHRTFITSKLVCVCVCVRVRVRARAPFPVLAYADSCIPETT